ncbi:MAG: hypothetical protein ACR2QG_04705 [Gammaproteobacteria bacterium]
MSKRFTKLTVPDRKIKVFNTTCITLFCVGYPQTSVSGFEDTSLAICTYITPPRATLNTNCLKVLPAEATLSILSPVTDFSIIEIADFTILVNQTPWRCQAGDWKKKQRYEQKFFHQGFDKPLQRKFCKKYLLEDYLTKILENL